MVTGFGYGVESVVVSQKNMNYQHFLFNLCDLILSTETGEHDETFAKWTLELGGPSFLSVNLLKDRGNAFFKDGNISTATLHYNLALQLLCFLGLPPESEHPQAFSCAISSILNLAFCELKLKHYTKVLLYCTFVLTFEPSNAKAFYRRGLASKYLHSLTEALDDFESALRLDPGNKDISREHTWVVEELAFKSNGKRIVQPFDPLPSNKKGKKPLMSECFVEKCNSPGADEASTSFGKRASPSSDHLHSPVDENVDENDGIATELATAPMEFENSEPTETLHDSSATISTSCTFTNKKHPYKKLNLSSKDYDNLLHGKHLGLFHPRSMTFMRVRTLPSKTIQTGTPQVEIFGTAEVPTSPQLSTEEVELPTSTIDNEQVVQDEVVVQITKKKRVSSVSAQATEVSTCQFQFAAVGISKRRVCKHTEGFSHHRSRVTRSNGYPTKQSAVSVDFSFSLCRYVKGGAAVRTAKRKDASLFYFDQLFHSPRKRRRLTYSVLKSCNVNFVGCFTNTHMDSGIPGFVL